MIYCVAYCLIVQYRYQISESFDVTHFELQVVQSDFSVGDSRQEEQVATEELGNTPNEPDVQTRVDENRLDEQASAEELGHTPNQPNVKTIPTQVLADKTLSFQERWFRENPWLHYCPMRKAVLCFYCCRAFRGKKPKITTKADSAFINVGFKNWRKAVEKFENHGKSQSHKHAVTTYIHEAQPITATLSCAQKKQQEQARENLLKIVGGIQYLARQGNAFRGHEQNEGNFKQLLQYKAEDDPKLASWLAGKQNFTSPMIQNEILQIISNSIIKEIAQEVQHLPVVQYSLIIDGTQDIAGIEQECICIRYVGEDIDPREEFVGLYETNSTTGESIAKVATDVMLRLNLPISQLRGQTYDGAANMSGKVQGVQALLRREQPLAPYIHCGPHCINLVAQMTISASSVVRNSLDAVNELGSFSNQSGKFKSIFSEIAKSNSVRSTSLKPLCPTRWTVRTPAIQSVLSQYDSVLTSLEEMVNCSVRETASRANGLHEVFLKGNTVLGLKMAADVMSALETLNTSLQSRRQTISGMMLAVEHVKRHLENRRTEEHFEGLYVQAQDIASSLDLVPIKMPHIRCPPKRLSGPAEPHIHPSAESFYRSHYFNMLDTAARQLTQRFDEPGIHTLGRLEKVLISGEMDDIIKNYPELDQVALKVRLQMHRVQRMYYLYSTDSKYMVTVMFSIKSHTIIFIDSFLISSCRCSCRC